MKDDALPEVEPAAPFKGTTYLLGGGRSVSISPVTDMRVKRRSLGGQLAVEINLNGGDWPLVMPAWVAAGLVAAFGEMGESARDRLVAELEEMGAPDA